MLEAARYGLLFRLMRHVTPALHRFCQEAFDVRHLVPRPMTLFLQHRFAGESLVGCEVGVASGWNAQNIFESLNIRRMYLVDPYLPYVEDDVLLTRYQNGFSEMKKNLKRFWSRIVFIQKKSSEAVTQVEGGLDFVYVDGNHSYPFVRDDIRLYFGKVREGGVFGGHDFNFEEHYGVVKAVLEWIEETGLKLCVEGRDWWVVKPMGEDCA